MSKSAKEQVIEYIKKQHNKEKEKWEAGLKSKYYEWKEIMEEILIQKTKDERLEELEQEVRLKTKYMVQTGQLKDFNEWSNKQ